MNPYQRYQNQMVSTMTQGDLLLMLYDEVIKQFEIARVAIDKKDVVAMDNALNKANRIIRHLRSTLDNRYPVSANLSKLYAFFDSQVVMASVKKDRTLLDEIEPMIIDLRATFDQCNKTDRAGRVGTPVGGAV